MFKPTSAKTPEEYIDLIAEPRKSEIIKLHKFIQKCIPNLKPHILYGMIGYGSYHYKYASGREGEWSVVLLASQKNYISVYVCGVKDGKYIAEAHKKDFPKASIGKSCIRFKKIDDIDVKVLEKIIKESEKSPLGYSKT
ncbi:MAG: hypothetical protein A2687_05200 [Candidatus Levybacteria bacterium RIFCSPHIGHO2_01_FULL_38_26]|nr:MAG: hypothetical protein A2687_05200 [Candidatus Levybacteria bacterium RIFCSPHIGHO2_01_FULL_38_26]